MRFGSGGCRFLAFPCSGDLFFATGFLFHAFPGLGRSVEVRAVAEAPVERTRTSWGITVITSATVADAPAERARTSRTDHTARGARLGGISSSGIRPIMLPFIRPSGLFWSGTLKNSIEMSDELSSTVGATEAASAADAKAAEADLKEG